MATTPIDRMTATLDFQATALSLQAQRVPLFGRTEQKKSSRTIHQAGFHGERITLAIAKVEAEGAIAGAGGAGESAGERFSV